MLSQEDTIKERVGILWARVTNGHPSWPDAVIRLTIAALCVYALRMGDVAVHDHILLLHIVEGQNRVRAHEGVCWFYGPYGSRDLFQGTIPEGALVRARGFLLCLEGLLRSFQGQVPRTEEGVMTAVEAAFAEDNVLVLNTGATGSATEHCTMLVICPADVMEEAVRRRTAWRGEMR